MNTSVSTMTALHDSPALSSLPGLAGLMIATLATALAGTLPATATLILPLLASCALLQIVAGLNEWHSQRPLIAVVFVSFGLFTCAEMSLLHGVISAVSAGSLLFFWAIFAALLAAHAENAGRPFRLLLFALSLTLATHALLFLCNWSLLRHVALFFAFATAAAAVAAAWRILSLRN